MATGQRFQTLFESEQRLFVPDCPLWVSRCRLSLDLDTGKRLLQVRLVNRSGRPVDRVFLRVVCYDSAGSRLPQLEYVPLPAASAAAGAVFGDGLVTELASPAAARVEVCVQRVRFLDAGVWDEDPRQSCIRFSPPTPIRPGDAQYDRFRRAAAEEGVRSDFYFHRQSGVWICSCGVPNGDREAVCARCGAKREWLERHMDPQNGPAPDPQASEAQDSPDLFPPDEPEPQLWERPVSVPPSPIRQAEQWSRTPAPAAGSPRPDPRTEPMPDQSGLEKAEHRGRIAAIASAAVALLLVGILCGYCFLAPYLRYRRGVREQAAGSYAAASAIFESLGDYRDSRAMAEWNKVRQGVALMQEQNYEQALALLEGRKGCEGFTADCFYSLSVLACNEGDVDRAMDYLARLEALTLDYPQLPQLRSCVWYSKGNRLAAEAAETYGLEKQITLYRQAIVWFRDADYADSEQRIKECSYRIACNEMGMDWLVSAISNFAQLDGYKDSADLIRTCQQRYVEEHLSEGDGTALLYLQSLAESGDPKYMELLDRANGEGFSFLLTWEGEGEVPLTSPAELRLGYSVPYSAGVPIHLYYELPDGRSGTVNYRIQNSAGTVSWEELQLPADCSVSGEIVLAVYAPPFGEGSSYITLLAWQSVPYEGGTGPEASDQNRE